MCNIVIFSNNLKFIKKYHNILISNFMKNNMIIEIASTKSELSSIIKKHSIDFIIMNYDSFNKKPLQQFLSNINNKIIIYSNSIIKLNDDPNIVFLNENLSNKIIISALQKILGSSIKQSIRKSVNNLLKSLNFDFKLKGTHYLSEAIEYCYLNKNKYLYDNLEKNVYSIISKNNSVSICVVKHSIIRAINNINSNDLKKKFKNLDKFTSKSVITELVNNL